MSGRGIRRFKGNASNQRGRNGRNLKSRGRFRYKQRNNENLSVAEKSADCNIEKNEYDIEKDSKIFFTGTASTDQHLTAQNTNRFRYAATLAVLVKSKIQITQNACIKALAMAWARGDCEMASSFLQLHSHFGLTEVLKSVTMLDAGRQVRGLEKRLKYLQLSVNKVKPQKIGKLKSDIDNLNRLKPPMGSASGATCKHVRKWVQEFKAEDLEFFAIHFPKDPWIKLADLCHLKPERDFPSAKWFLSYCFGTGSPPVESMVEICQTLSEENVNDLIQIWEIPYSVLKKYKDKLNPESKRRIAEYEPKLDTILWWYEDLRCTEVDEVISKRLESGEEVNLPNGKLLERLLTIFLLRNPHLDNCLNNSVELVREPEIENFLDRLIDVTEPRLTSLRVNLESPIVIIGDASGSMQTAIRTSTIIASLLTVICSAKLVFFNDKSSDAPFLPKTVREILKLTATTIADGGTTPAASMMPFYASKDIVKTFIIVTDEEENGEIDGYRFAPLYKKYFEEVFPANLVFVSFLRNQHSKGQMITALNELGYHPKQIKLETSRPDLTKLDDLFAQMSAVTTSSFIDQLNEAESLAKSLGISHLYSTIKDNDEYKTDIDTGTH
ncbi:hypothetical protein Bpfe_022157 [Biomphalaria pfeifferi]|uniref:TROVE domain-containing protein n=1 Tax=Biomphalaria pfeifferi TaxID=112525 RepID=A0AAD8B5F7_BIOPF|nr:hypothetical protein Bpfe_022157 [Biomphalaria pfeifferi]